MSGAPTIGALAAPLRAAGNAWLPGGVAAAGLPRRRAARRAAARCAAALGLPAGVGVPLLRLCDHLRRDVADGAGRGLRRHLRPQSSVLPVPDVLRVRRHPETRRWRCWRSSSAYRGAGLELADDELPDHLAVRARVRRRRPARRHRGPTLLREHRTGLELLRLALRRRRVAPTGARGRGCRTLPALPAPTATPAAGSPGRPAERGRRPQPLRVAGSAQAPLSERPAHRSRAARSPADRRRPAVGGLPLRLPRDPRRRALIWRYRYDKSAGPPAPPSSTSAGSCDSGRPLFHFGILVVAPRARRRPARPEDVDRGASASAEDAYHVIAVCVGTVAGVCTLVGMAHPDLPPAHRRPGVHGHHAERQGHVRGARRGRSCSGCATTCAANVLGDDYDYRETVSLWFRSHLLPPARRRP